MSIYLARAKILLSDDFPCCEVNEAYGIVVSNSQPALVVRQD